LTHWQHQRQHDTKLLSQLPYAFYVVAKDVLVKEHSLVAMTELAMEPSD